MSNGSNLARYIKSKGILLPDLSKKLAGEAYEFMCAFCDNPHGGQPLIRYAVPGTSLGAVFTGAFLCWDCQEEVEKMCENIGGPPPKSTLFDGVEDTTIGRVELYAVHQKFDQTVDFHFGWREEPSSKSCYFCKGPALEGYANIPVPVRIHPNDVNGGDVRMCADCRILCERLFGTQHTYPTAKLERCAKCHGSYLIDMEELEYRKSPPGTSELHMCPDCVAEELTYPKDRIVYETENPLKRFLEHTCEYCDSPFLVDVTVLRSVLFKWHMSKAKKLMCEQCFEGSPDGPVIVFEVNTTKFRVYENGPGYAIIYKVGSETKFLSTDKNSLSDFIVLLHTDPVVSKPTLF